MCARSTASRRSGEGWAVIERAAEALDGGDGAAPAADDPSPAGAVDLRQRLAALRALDLRGPPPEGLQQADAAGGSAPRGLMTPGGVSPLAIELPRAPPHPVLPEGG